MRARILVVDDEQSMLDMLRLLLADKGYKVTTSGSMAEGRAAFAEGEFDLVLCDILMPDGNGLDLLREIKASDSRTAVIMMTAYSSSKAAIEAMKAGAYDYLTKPFDNEELTLLIQKALEKTELVQENVYLRQELEERYGFTNIIGQSRPMQEVFKLIARVAQTNSTVVIEGESGTGKELIARAIHFASPRSGRRFLSVNCAALPETLLDSELFGHERGAFTGAVKEKKGLFQEASGGTLFLDEIGEMSLGMQVKVLRALQEKRVRKVGGTVEDVVDVRILAATNKNLEERIKTGEFREDLYYRINVIPIKLPPLRERREDIPLLVDFFVKKCSKDLGVEPKKISTDAMCRLEAYHWPGNVRELENLVARALTLCAGEVITDDDIPSHLRRSSPALGAASHLPEDGLDLEGRLDDIRSDLMAQALDRCGGVQTQAAELLRMSFRSFRYYAKKMRLTGVDEETGTETDASAGDA